MQFPDNYWSLENPVVYDDIMDVAVGPEGEAVRDSWRSSSHNPVITTLLTDKNTYNDYLSWVSHFINALIGSLEKLYRSKLRP